MGRQPTKPFVDADSRGGKDPAIVTKNVNIDAVAAKVRIDAPEGLLATAH